MQSFKPDRRDGFRHHASYIQTHLMICAQQYLSELRTDVFTLYLRVPDVKNGCGL